MNTIHLKVNAKSWSYFVIVLWCMIFLFFGAIRPVWKYDKGLAPTSWDVGGYYLYLPALFVHQDIRQLAWSEAMMKKYEPASYFYFAHKSPKTGNYVCAYTAGMSVAFLPFFFVGHTIAYIGGWTMDGYSLPYMLMIYIAGGFYSFLGLLVLRKFLLVFFDDRIVALTLFSLIFGTNWLHYSIFENGMTHNYLFAAYTGFLWCVHRWHKDKLLKHALGLGLFGGWAILTRPTEIIMALLFLLWGVQSFQDITTRIQELWKYKTQIAVAIFTAFLLFFPQMLYWKWSADEWIYTDGYGTNHFEFLHPFLLQGLFSIRKGWLVYTPIMWLAVLGLYALYQKKKDIFYPIIIYSLINIWIVFSWSCWYYGGGYSARALVQSYAVWAIPLGFLYYQCLKINFLKYTIYLFSFAAIFLNLIQNYQYRYGLIGTEGHSKYTYQLAFGKIHIDKDDIKRFEFKDIIAPETIHFDKLIFKNNFEMDSSLFKTKGIAHSDSTALVSNDAQNKKYLCLYQNTIKNSELQPKNWIRASIYAYMNDYDWNYDMTPVLYVQLLNEQGQSKWYRHIKIAPLIGNDGEDAKGMFYGHIKKWGQVWIDVQLPENVEENDKLDIGIRNDNNHAIWIDDFQLQKNN